MIDAYTSFMMKLLEHKFVPLIIIAMFVFGAIHIVYRIDKQDF